LTVALSPAERARYSRHLVLPEIGAAGQERLKAARVLVIGAGGLGSPAALYLAAAGVGHLGLLDCDRVDVSNLQRQVLYTSADVGLPKAALARARLAALNPEIHIEAHALELHAANIREVFAQYDIILDGTDRIATRYLVNDACVLLRKPLVSAAIHRFEGQAMTYVPDRGPCYRCLFPEAAEGLVPNCAEAGVLGVLPGVLGAVQATEAIKLIVQQGEPLIGRLLAYDALELRFREFRFARRRDCAVCGEQPSITTLRDPPGFCSEDELRRVRRLSAQELQRLLGAPEPPVLIDVREPAEYAAGHLRAAVNIPMSQLPTQLPELRHDRPTVFICRSGARSLRACAAAARAGLTAPLQLDGGLLAWHATVDPTLEVAAVS
jgi:molybdopterin/thiamine biosynthesis adenylyltransferase/rhodanese-related sulfurtransferase